MEKLSVVRCQLSVAAGGGRGARCLNGARQQNRLSIPNGHRFQRTTDHGQRTTRRGFSFTEILFAVMILGIGFIMVAAMFPVAIKQTQATGEETVAAAIARSGSDYLARNAFDLIKYTQPPYNQPQYGSPNYNTMPPVLGPPPQAGLPAPSVVVAAGPFWDCAVGNMILPSDRRYAWVPFYRRDLHSNFAQVILIGTQVRNRSSYDATDFIKDGGTTGNANLQGKLVTVTFTDGSPANVPDTITFMPFPNSRDYTGFVAEGCYVVIANDPGRPVPPSPNQNNNPPQVLQTANGYVYRVGNLVSGTTWELMPGNDMKGASYKPTPTMPNRFQGPIWAYIVGRGFTNMAANPPDASPTGPAMDIAVYTTFVRVNVPQ